MIKAIIFDCFNVLIGDATKQLLESLSEEQRDEFRAVAHAVDKGIIPDHEGIVEQSRLIGISEDEFISTRNKGELPNQQLLEYAASLKGRYKLAVLSNIASYHRMAIRFPERTLDTVFDTVVASGEVGYIKPQPEIFQIAADRLGVAPEECVMIDDIIDNCDGARAIGMKAVHFQTNQQAIADLEALIDRGE